MITAESLTRWYGRRVGIERVDLSVREGEIFGFLGPNGAGKTTTIRILLGFLRPGAGTASVLGRDAWADGPAIRRDVGYVPGDLRLYSWMTPRTALATIGRVRRRDLGPAGRDLADRFNLEMDVTVRRMSRGMRQKLGLILALAPRPRVLVLDEPTSGLDPIMRERLAECLRGFARDGHTVFFSSHSLGEVERLCDRVAIVRRGRIVADETIVALRARARRVVVLSFRDGAARTVAPPSFLDVTERADGHWRAELDGTARPLLEWAVEQPIDDVTINPPDLESLFQRFYRAETAETAETEGSPAPGGDA